MVNPESKTESLPTQTPINPKDYIIFDPIVLNIEGDLCGCELDYFEILLHPVIEFRNIHRDRNDNLVAEISLYCLSPKTLEPIQSRFINLSSFTSFRKVIDVIKASSRPFGSEATSIDWEFLLTDAINRAITFYHEHSQPEEIMALDDTAEPTFLIYPLLPLNQPTILFGDGGTGKGHLAMLLGLIATLPYFDNELGLIAPKVSTPTLYLDYEADRNDFENTLSNLCRGIGEFCSFYRIPAFQPLPDIANNLHLICQDKKIKLMIIDSLGPACGGNPNDAEAAIKMFNALRQFPDITKLLIAHNSKDPLTKSRTPFGSVFFLNLARSVWEVKKAQEVDSNIMTLALTHRKYNRRQQLPIGLELTFADDGPITMKRVDLSTTELSTEMPIHYQITDLLKYEGLLTQEEIAEALGRDNKSIHTILYRHKDRFIKLEGNKWGLVTTQ